MTVLFQKLILNLILILERKVLETCVIEGISRVTKNCWIHLNEVHLDA